MKLVTIILLTPGLAADAFAVSLSSGLRIRKIKFNKALKSALFFGSFQALMPLLGWVAGLSVSSWLSAIDHFKFDWCKDDL